MAKIPAELTMQRETRVKLGPSPRSLTDEPLREESWQLVGSRFLLRATGDHYFYYARGHGITVERGSGTDLAEETLWLNGSVYAAIASINGLLPIHASAIAHEGAVYAFAGPPGAGKSTIIAALGARGLPMFCDDTLVLDVSAAHQINCLPGHKRLKLTMEALALTGAAAEERVSSAVEKFYAAPAAGSVRTMLPLAELIFLEDGDSANIIPVTGGERLVRLQDDHYTAQLFDMARQFDRRQRFGHLASLAGKMRMTRLVRPREKDRFPESVALVEQHIKGQPRSSPR